MGSSRAYLTGFEQPRYLQVVLRGNDPWLQLIDSYVNSRGLIRIPKICGRVVDWGASAEGEAECEEAEACAPWVPLNVRAALERSRGGPQEQCAQRQKSQCVSSCWRLDHDASR